MKWRTKVSSLYVNGIIVISVFSFFPFFVIKVAGSEVAINFSDAFIYASMPLSLSSSTMSSMGYSFSIHS